ncbi:MAG: hypothetical protein R2751_08280 [Bacteroidales bacterium]
MGGQTRQFPGVGQGGLGHLGPGQHAGDLVYAFPVLQERIRV